MIHCFIDFFFFLHLFLNFYIKMSRMKITECFISPSFLTKKIFLKKQKNGNPNSRKKIPNLSVKSLSEDKASVGKTKLEAEKIFFEGPPSKLELVIPFFSIITVIGLIPFVASLVRQFWVRYRITNRRISVDSGFGGNSRVEIVYRDIKEVNYISRFGGKMADVVVVLKDDAQLELRSLPEWEENLDFIQKNIDLNKKKNV
mmetsp:Transcript_61262/g.126548  ORF Transcript_61262/g.126548 Transcript_61262/m.126548 type:complete len:201 (-) Transcript_61262:4087-4689(-)